MSKKQMRNGRRFLSPEAYRVTREKGTETPFTGEYWATFEDGIYKCSNCEEPLLISGAKFDASCGWPEFQCSKMLAKLPSMRMAVWECEERKSLARNVARIWAMF